MSSNECVELCKKTEFRHDNHGSMSKGTGSQQYIGTPVLRCRIGGAEGTNESVLALNTDVCRVQEETREVTSVEEGHDVERVVETTW